MSDFTEETHFREARNRMVTDQILARGIQNPGVIAALLSVPRHLFVHESLRDLAYNDHPVIIDCDQTISQPYMAAVMMELLHPEPGVRLLEVGTGSGYQAALLACLSREVITMERHETLYRDASERLAKLGYANVTVVLGDGSLGYPTKAPYQGILVTAGAPEIPPALLDQLAEGGRLVLPVGDRSGQQLVCITRHGTTFNRKSGISCRFVPLIGTGGWPPA